MTELNSSQILTLLSSVLGIIGTLVLFKFSYALEPLDSAQFGDADVIEAYIAKRNKKRIIGQKIGIAFLFASFCCTGITVWLK